LRRFSKQCLCAKASKCTFLSSELEYLGHMVGHDRIKVNPRTVSAWWIGIAFVILGNLFVEDFAD